jgi:hypothetical protein
MDPAQPQGWYADPFGRHEFRYFSAGAPTRLVRDGAVESYDELPARLWLLPEVATTSSASRAERNGVRADPERPVRRRKPSLAYISIALLSAIAAAAAVVIWGGSGPNSKAGSGSPRVSLAAVVARSAHRTLARQTADITVQGMVDTGTSEVGLRGNGQEDFATNTWAMTMSWTVAGTTVVENEIAASKDQYFQLTIDGSSIGQHLGGRQWFESPAAVSAAQVAPQHSPAWSLQLLERQGARVVPMGAQNIGGVECDEYTVTPTKQAMLAASRHEWAELGLSGPELVAGQQLVENSTTPTFTIWLSPRQQLACQLGVYLPLGMESASGSASAPSVGTLHLLMTFSHYGVPVSLTPPPLSDTVSF